MRRVVGVLACAVLVLVASYGRLPAQGGTIQGRVADRSGAPLARATVSIEAIGARAMTRDEGNYELRGVPAGTHTVRVRLLGYVPQTARVAVSEGQTVRQDFSLESQPIGLAPVDVIVGTRARHTAADELAVPVDVFTSEQIQQQGTTETSQILQALSPSINFPRQSVTDANDIVRPFTLRGLSPDHTLVLVNGWRRHPTALVNNFTYGMGPGSSGVDMNTIPQSALDRIEVLRDGASAQYGSDAIAGVVNLVLREGRFTPFANVTAGRYIPDDYSDDGTTVNVNGGWGIGLGRGSLGLFGEFLDRQPTNRAWADAGDSSGTGLFDEVDGRGRVVIKRNPVPQPNHHWGDGLEKDILTMANFRMPLNEARTSEVYSFGGYSFRRGTGNGYRRYAYSERNWPEIYPLGFLPEFRPDVTDYSAAGGFRALAGGWSVDLGASFGHNDFEYNMRNTLNASLGPCLDTSQCAPADVPPGPDGTVGTADDPGPNKTSFFAGRLEREELVAGINAAKALNLGLPAPVNVGLGAAFRLERYEITRGEYASFVNGRHLDQFGDSAVPGSQVFAGFKPSDEADADRTNFGVYADLETNLSPRFLANIAGRFESYSDFGERATGKVAFRYQPSPRLTLRAAGSTGFRAPGLSQIHFSKVVTNVIAGEFREIGLFPTGHAAASLLGSRPLQEETSVNVSAGLAVSPRDNLTITADYFYVNIDDRILLSATFDEPAVQAILAAGGFTDIAGVQYFTNGLDTETKGVDITANLLVPVGAAGTLDLTGAVTWAENSIVRVDPLPAPLQGSGEAGLLDEVTQVGIEEERPDWRGTFTAQYTAGRFHGLARASYFGEFASSQPCFSDGCRETYGAKTLLDAELGYRFNQVDLSVGVRNLFDTYPDRPQDDFNNNFGTFPWAAASPFGYNGRYIYTRAAIALIR